MRFFDLALIAAYLIGITWFGARFRHSQKTLRDYFLGGRNAPWWAIAFSIVSAETSTLTVIGTPALAFRGNFGFLQLVLGYLLARILISLLFLPQYFRGELYTAYELMERRFGMRLRRLTAGLFLSLRALAEGVRVFAVSIIVSIILGLDPFWAIAVIVALTLFYTFEGGMTAVIWTDVVQMSLYVAGAVLSVFTILSKLPHGWPQFYAAATLADKFRIFDFSFSPTLAWFSQPYTFWAGILGGCFLCTASHGTEQLIVQRLLAARDLKASRKALFGSWIVVGILFSLFLLIGAILWSLYTVNHWQVPEKVDRIYPQFIWDNLPVGVAGLVMAAILAAAMSNLSAALNSLSSTTVMDFYRRSRPDRTETHYVSVARFATLGWGAVLLTIGVLAQRVNSVLEAGLGIASILYGGLLGVFLLGLIWKRVSESAAMMGMAAGILGNLFIALRTPIAFTWYVLIGTLITISVSLVASVLRREYRDPVAAR
jgi:solute:Na+ symporter, SSS family